MSKHEDYVLLGHDAVLFGDKIFLFDYPETERRKFFRNIPKNTQNIMSKSINSSSHITASYNAICTLVYAEPPTRRKTNGYYNGDTHRLPNTPM